MNERMIDLTDDEWALLGQLPLLVAGVTAQGNHKKLLRLDLAKEKAGKFVTTFEGRLMLRQHQKTGAQ